MRWNGLIFGLCGLLAAISLHGCTSLSGSYPATDPEVGFKYAQEAIERADWASAYRHLEHILYLSDDAVKARARAMLVDHQEIAEAAQASFSKPALHAYAQTHPNEYPWVKIRLEVYEDNVGTPQEATWARSNVAEVYAEEVAILAETSKRQQAEGEARGAWEEAVKAEKIRRSIARTCGSPVFGGICLGEAVDGLRQRLSPRIDIDDGTNRRLVFNVGPEWYGVIAREGRVVAILQLFPSTSWLDFATHKLRLERAFGAQWNRTIRLPEKEDDRESREQAIRDGRGLIELNTLDESLVLSMRGPEGIRLENIHPEYVDAFRSTGEKDTWREHAMLPLLQASHAAGDSGAADDPVMPPSPPPNPVVTVVFRRGTSLYDSGVDHGWTEAEEHFTRCVQQGISDTRPSIRLVDSDDLLAKTTGGTMEELISEVPGKPTTALPMDVNTLVFVDGRPKDGGTMHCDTNGGAPGCIGSDGLFFCGGGHGGAGCLGLAQFRSPYRLSVTVIDAVDWRALQQLEARTNEKRTIAAGFIIPVWWTFGPDWAECTDIGRQIADYLDPAANGD